MYKCTYYGLVWLGGLGQKGRDGLVIPQKDVFGSVAVRLGGGLIQDNPR